jgi:hypothetical protein
LNTKKVIIDGLGEVTVCPLTLDQVENDLNTRPSYVDEKHPTPEETKALLAHTRKIICLAINNDPERKEEITPKTLGGLPFNPKLYDQFHNVFMTAMELSELRTEAPGELKAVTDTSGISSAAA